MSIEIPYPLIEEINKGRVSLFIGAGASLEANFPTTNDLTEFLINKSNKSFFSFLKEKSLDSVSQILYTKPGYGKQWVRNKIIDYFENEHDKVHKPPSKAHELLTKFRWRTIFTTNYDRLIEITYDSSSCKVQRILPIYAPDPQILRHDQDVVRLIKLNGSIDEASRNSNHDLVLTFSEQRDAVSNNKEFYDLLHEEAIIGPIIFIGFRFVHPGSNTIGSSPEFQQLRDILKEIGPLARWHYCISPLDTKTQEGNFINETLRDSKIHVIDSSFGTFIKEVIKIQKEAIVSLTDRPPVIIPVAQQTIKIEAEEFERDKRHFEIIGNYLEKVEAPTITESLNGYQNWGSFLEKHLIDRLCKKDFKDVINNSINKAPEILLLSGSAGWGKTFLLCDLSIDFYREGRPVIWLNPYSTIEKYTSTKRNTIAAWDSSRLNNIMGMIEETIGRHSSMFNKAIPIIIADNCPERATEVLTLFRELVYNNKKFVLIFSVRDYEFETLISEHPIFKKARYFLPERNYDSRNEVKALIDFCCFNKVAIIEDEKKKIIAEQRIIDEKADSAIILALQIIYDKEHRPFSDIVRDIWESLPTDPNEISKKLVLRVASLHRFGSLSSPRFYSLMITFPSKEHDRVLKIYKFCLQKGIFIENIYEDEPCVSTRHSLIAEHICKISGKTPVEIDDELICLIKSMTINDRDLEIIRRLLKQITDYKISLSSEEKIEEIFNEAAKSTLNDYIVCQQYAKFLIQREEHESALAWSDRAIDNNPDNPSLHHTKGNVLKRWGMKLFLGGEKKLAEKKFTEARKCFSISRVKRDPDEYGYVTHLDMLLSLIREEKNEYTKACLYAEGAQLYKDGIITIPKDRFNLFLYDRFSKYFDIEGKNVKYLCSQIEVAIEKGKASIYAASYLAQKLFENGEFDKAIDVIKKQREVNNSGIFLWVKEAELNAKNGNFIKAKKCIDSAKRREKEAENSEAHWRMMYWDLVISILLQEYNNAREVAIKLSETGYLSRKLFPQGYIWKDIARNIKSEKRSFKNHGKIWSGRIDVIKADEQYGQIAITNLVGEKFYISFNPTYFSRRDLRKGDYIEFIITILPSKLRADDISSQPFTNTIDDIYVP